MAPGKQEKKSNFKVGKLIGSQHDKHQFLETVIILRSCNSELQNFSTDNKVIEKENIQSICAIP
jgi:hypothetical protein